jgi:hypothetical protein
MLDDASSDDVLVPDMRGYGQSSTPQNVEAYGTKKNTDDLAALLGKELLELRVALPTDYRAGLLLDDRMSDLLAYCFTQMR